MASVTIDAEQRSPRVSGGKVRKFAGHHAYIVGVAKMCQESGKFTDVLIQCQDGQLMAHRYTMTVSCQVRAGAGLTWCENASYTWQLLFHCRLVLAACSPFLREVFLSLPQGLAEFTLVIPHIKKQVVAILIDFLYTVSESSPKGHSFSQGTFCILEVTCLFAGSNARGT